MEDHAQPTGPRQTHMAPEPYNHRIEPTRARWAPKPEQILILESIFNNGMVNPPKDETVRIRKVLERFGAVGDANVFYWFQNRRSRSRRRQRQMAAAAAASGGDQGKGQETASDGGGGGNTEVPCENFLQVGIGPSSSCYFGPETGRSTCVVGSSSSSSSANVNENYNNNNNNSDDFFSFLGHPPGLAQEYEQSPVFGSPDLNYHPEPDVITVFINGVATHVGRGPVDMKAMGGGDFVMYHSSGVPLQMNEYGFLVDNLHHGESYFLVPRHSEC